MTQAQITIGQEVVIAHHGSFTTHYNFGYTVAKVTPSGQVVVKRTSDGQERRFDKHLREMGVASYRGDTLYTDVAEIRARVAKKDLAHAASDAIKAVRVDDCKPTYGLDYMQEQVEKLQALVDAARTAVDALAKA